MSDQTTRVRINQPADLRHGHLGTVVKGREHTSTVKMDTDGATLMFGNCALDTLDPEPMTAWNIHRALALTHTLAWDYARTVTAVYAVFIAAGETFAGGASASFILFFAPVYFLIGIALGGWISFRPDNGDKK